MPSPVQTAPEPESPSLSIGTDCEEGHATPNAGPRTNRSTLGACTVPTHPSATGILQMQEFHFWKSLQGKTQTKAEQINVLSSTGCLTGKKPRCSETFCAQQALALVMTEQPATQTGTKEATAETQRAQNLNVYYYFVP